MSHFTPGCTRADGAAHHRLAVSVGISLAWTEDCTTANSDNGSSSACWLRPGLGLSGKLLLLTTVFVMVVEILIYVPSIANFRIMWLKDRLAAARAAALVLDAAPSGMVPESLAQQILDGIARRSPW